MKGITSKKVSLKNKEQNKAEFEKKYNEFK